MSTAAMPATAPKFFGDITRSKIFESNVGKTVTQEDLEAAGKFFGDAASKEEPQRKGNFTQAALSFGIAAGLARQIPELATAKPEYSGFGFKGWSLVRTINANDTLNIHISVAEIKPVPSLNYGKVTFNVQLRNQQDQIVADGEWILHIDVRPAPGPVTPPAA